MAADHRDVVIEMLADAEAALRQDIDMLLNLVAHLAFENFLLNRLLERELVERIHADGALDRERRRRHRYQQGAVA